MSNTYYYPCLHNIRLSYNIGNTSVVCQSESTCLHKTVNLVGFYVKSNAKTYPKGRALMQKNRVIPITKKENISLCNL